MTGWGGGSTPVQVVRSCFDAWSRGDLERALAHMHDNCTYTLHVPEDVLVFGGRHEGREAIGRYLSAVRAEFHFLAYALGRLRQEEGVVRGQIVFYFRHATTGEMLDGRSRLLAVVTDGLIDTFDEYHDVPKLRAFLEMARRQNRPEGGQGIP